MIVIELKHQKKNVKRLLACLKKHTQLFLSLFLSHFIHNNFQEKYKSLKHAVIKKKKSFLHEVEMSQ